MINSENIISEIIKNRLYGTDKTWIPVKQEVLMNILSLDLNDNLNFVNSLVDIVNKDQDLILDLLEHIITLKPRASSNSDLKHGIVLIGARATVAFVKNFYAKEIFKEFGYFFTEKDLAIDNFEVVKMLEISSTISTFHSFFTLFEQKFRVMINYKSLGRNLALQFLNLELKNNSVLALQLQQIKKKDAFEITTKHNRHIIDLVMENWNFPTSFKYKFGLGEKNPQITYLTVFNYFNVINFLYKKMEKIAKMDQFESVELKNEFLEVLTNEQFVSIKHADATLILRKFQEYINSTFKQKIKEYGLEQKNTT